MALARVNVNSGGGGKAKLVSVPVQSGTLTYSGSVQSPTWSGYDATQLTTSGTTSATNAGTYTATFTLKSGYTWADNTVSPKSVSWTIGKATVSVPTVTNTSFTYDGSSHAPTVGAYNSNFITVTNTAQTNAGSYSVTFTLKDTSNCKWSDGTIATKTVAWTITTATATLSTSISNSSLVYGDTATISITANRSGGAISATSSNPAAVVIQSVTSTTITVKCVGVSSNTTTITVTAAATKDYSSCTSTHSVTTEKADGSVTLSATDGTVTYGTPLTFTVTGNVSGGALSVTSSSNTYATASISGNAVTVNCVKYSATSRTITVKSAATANYKQATATFTADLARLFLAPPAITNTSFTYDGNSHAPTIGSYNSEYITVTNTAQTDAGSYDVVFALKDTTNCRWDDDTTKNKTVAWTIAKAGKTLSLDLDKLVAPPGQTATLKIESVDNGAMTVTSSNTSVAQASLDESLNLVVELINEGTATLTVSQAETDNYKAASVTLPVKCKNPVAITDSWGTISTRSKNGTAANYYDVGDYKEITLNGKIGDCLTLTNEKLRVFILHINYPMDGTPENNIIWGGFKTADGTDVALCDSEYDKSLSDGTICFNINHWGNRNYGGWKGCDLRYDVLGATSTQPSEYEQAHTTSCVGYNATAATLTNPKADTLLAALPSDFRNVLRLWSRWVNILGGSGLSSDVGETIDAVTLLAEFEVQGACTHANHDEQNHQTQMAYYVAGNSKIKYNHSNTASPIIWWCSSCHRYSQNPFCCVRTDDSASFSNVSRSYAVAPAFKT